MYIYIYIYIYLSIYNNLAPTNTLLTKNASVVGYIYIRVVIITYIRVTTILYLINPISQTYFVDPL